MAGFYETLAPFFTEPTLRHRGIDNFVGLIALHGHKNKLFYPHAQFDTTPDGGLCRREAVIGIWNSLILPAIDDGTLQEWAATELLLQGTSQNPSQAEMIAKDPTLVEFVSAQITGSIAAIKLR